jgi:hypothetical protein
MSVARPLVLALALLFSPLSIGQAAELAVAFVSVSSPVAPFSDAQVQVQTSPGAVCDIAVSYKTGPSHAKGLHPATANGRGRVGWQWRVGSNTTPGHWPIAVSCAKGAERAEARTQFEVR